MSEENNQETVVIPETVVELSPLDVVQQEINQLKEKLEQTDKRLSVSQTEVRRIQNVVWEFFNGEFDGGEEEVSIHRDEANGRGRRPARPNSWEQGHRHQMF